MEVNDLMACPHRDMTTSCLALLNTARRDHLIIIITIISHINDKTWHKMLSIVSQETKNCVSAAENNVVAILQIYLTIMYVCPIYCNTKLDRLDYNNG